jgi:hypothetical protein
MLQCEGAVTQLRLVGGGGRSNMAVRLWSCSMQGLLLRVRFPRTRTVMPCQILAQCRKYLLSLLTGKLFLVFRVHFSDFFLFWPQYQLK